MLNALIFSALLGQASAPPMPPAAQPQVQQAAGQNTPPKVDPKHEADIKHDEEMGKQFVKDVEKQYKFSTNQEFLSRVRRIGNELAAIANAHQIKASWG